MSFAGRFHNFRFWLREYLHWQWRYHPRHYRDGKFLFDDDTSEPVLGRYRKVVLVRINHSYAGFFAYLTFALNQILFCERNNCLPVVDFGPWSEDGPNAYHDPDLGDNMWDYYFEPVSGYTAEGIRELVLDPCHPLKTSDVISLSVEDLWYLHTFEPDSIYAYTYGRHLLQTSFDAAWFNEQRQRANRVIREYVRIKPEILADVDRFEREFMQPGPIIGVHMRGTDKGAAAASVNAQQQVGPTRYQVEIDRFLAGSPEARVFVATDQQQWLEHLENQYGERLVSTDCLRSSGELAPFQLTEGSGYKKGLEVLIDALLLSRCDFLVKSASHVGEAALWFNPEMRSKDLNYES